MDENSLFSTHYKKRAVGIYVHRTTFGGYSSAALATTQIHPQNNENKQTKREASRCSHHNVPDWPAGVVYRRRPCQNITERDWQTWKSCVNIGQRAPACTAGLVLSAAVGGRWRCWFPFYRSAHRRRVVMFCVSWGICVHVGVVCRFWSCSCSVLSL